MEKAYHNPDLPLLTKEELTKAKEIIDSSPHCLRTPMLHQAQLYYGIDKNIDLHLKLENLQITGSFKIRGIVAQFENLPEGCGTEENRLVTMSAGNYGKAFAYICNKRKLKGMVILPDTAPQNRVQLIQSYGCLTEQVPTIKLQEQIDKHVSEEGMLFMHSYDDPSLIRGYGSIGFEILEEVADPDIVLVCCGGGGCVAGIAAAIKQSGVQCRIYAVEPEGSRTMYESYRAGHPVGMAAKSVASGLSPPNAGANTYNHCKAFVDDVLLVTDEEILAAMFHLYERRLLVEPSGSASFAALLFNKVPDVQNKKVVVVVTGGNVGLEELSEHAKTVKR